jgi:hypothetical protein
MRCAQNSRSQFPQRYCLICINLNNLSSKSRRRARLIKLLPQLGHAITRKCLYSLIERSKYLTLAYRLPLIPQNLFPHFVQLYGLIQANLRNRSRKLWRCDRPIITLKQRGHRIGANRNRITGKWSHNLKSTSNFDLPRSLHPQILSLLPSRIVNASDKLAGYVSILFPLSRDT